MRVLAVLPALFILGLSFSSLGPETASAETIEVTSRSLSSFRIGSPEQRRFGPLEFVGGLELTSQAKGFGAFSSLRLTDAGERMVGVTDTGKWFFGSIRRDEAGRPVAITNFSMQPLRNHQGDASGRKWTSDAESLAVRDTRAVVGYERTHRIVEFEIGDAGASLPVTELDPLIPREELRSNRGFETLAFSSPDSALAGALIVISERSLDPDGNILAAILEGPRKGVFAVRRHGGFDITDGAFLPNGDLLLLERQFTIATGIAMRLRRIDKASIAPGGVADGPVLLEADMAYQIDNMEGLDVWRGPNGSLIVSMISDNNHSLFQRNLYLEFYYPGE